MDRGEFPIEEMIEQFKFNATQIEEKTKRNISATKF